MDFLLHSFVTEVTGRRCKFANVIIRHLSKIQDSHQISVPFLNKTVLNLLHKETLRLYSLSFYPRSSLPFHFPEDCTFS